MVSRQASVSWRQDPAGYALRGHDRGWRQRALFFSASLHLGVKIWPRYSRFRRSTAGGL